MASLGIFADCAEKEGDGGYRMGFAAYHTWAKDLRDEAFYQNCDGEQLARRLSVNQFCALSLWDARSAARDYIKGCAGLLPGDGLVKLAALLDALRGKAADIRSLLDTGENLDGERAKGFWTAEKRLVQAEILDQMASLERDAVAVAKALVSENV